jgi:hypothetical protein
MVFRGSGIRGQKREAGREKREARRGKMEEGRAVNRKS